MILPHSPEAEQAVLGAMLIEEGLIPEITDILKPEDFYATQHRLIFQTITEITIGVDLVTVSEALKSTGRFPQTDGADYLSTLIQGSVPATALSHARIVKEKAIRREIMKTAMKVLKDGQRSDVKTALIVAEAEKSLMEASYEQKGFTTLGERIEDVLEMIEGVQDGNEDIMGLKTGFSGIDKIIDGCKKGEVTIVSGATKIGKTMFALNLARNWSVDRGLKGAYFSYEMLYKYLACRILVKQSGVRFDDIKYGRLNEGDWKRLTKFAGDLKSVKNLYFFDRIPPGVMSLYQRMRRIKEAVGLDYVIIDHLHLISEPSIRGGRTAEVGYVAKSIKSFANMFDVPVILLAQLNREFEKRTPPEPRHFDLRDSGEIEQIMAADILLFAPGTYREDEPQDKVVAITDLHRFGDTGRADLTFDKNRMSFEDRGYFK